MYPSALMGWHRLSPRICSRFVAEAGSRFRYIALVVAVGTLTACGGGGGSGSGDVGASTESPLQTETVATPPAAVTGLIARAGNSPTVTLTWNPSKNADAYVVYWSDSPGVSPGTAQAIREAQSPFVHEGVTPGRQYHYMVAALNAVGESGPSAEVSALLPPAAPTAVTALSGDSSILVSWQVVPYADRYRIYWSTQPGVSKTTGSFVDQTQNSLLHTGLQNGTAYYYAVTALGAGGEGPSSQQVSAAPRVPVPGAPADLTAQATSGSARSITLSWKVPPAPINLSDIIAYRVYRSPVPGIASNPSGATVFDGILTTNWVDVVPSSGTYYYVVTAVTSAGVGPWSSEVSATATDDTTGGGGSGGGDELICGEPVVCWRDTSGG
jgi:fibronectin type 3 domain-containing protein